MLNKVLKSCIVSIVTTNSQVLVWQTLHIIQDREKRDAGEGMTFYSQYNMKNDNRS